ncbi:retron Ec78 anti-phage system effector ATPase PtuA [Shewanella sp. 10N.286.45.A1]|uniref:retron Ec78 anti-phage system effector ATPase PtuA n=1 Tax=Shewanella sp. 10N.286.45.A1 TaxID=3229694 RepID=UPI00354FCBC4
MKQRNKAIRLLENNARKGNISASFQLFESMEKGSDIDIDLHKSQQHFESCKKELGFFKENNKELPANKITLDEVNLYFFRKFEELNIKLENDITIFIGNNGSGKTSILDSISKTFSWINARIITQGRNGKTLDWHDITIGKHENAEVNAIFSLGKKTLYKGSLVRSAKGMETAKSSNLENYKNLSNLYRIVNSRSREYSNEEINIPLFAFYSVDRSHIKSNMTFDLEKVSDNYSESRFDVIDKSVIDGTGNIEDFLRWFIFIDNQSKSSEIKDLEKVEAELSALKVVANTESHPLYKMLSEKEKEVSLIKNKVLSSKSAQKNATIEKVKFAITSAIPSISDIFVDRSSGRVEVRIINEGVDINIFQASKGQQVYFSLVADIARRLVQLNPTLTNSLHGQGIVLIDEIELHLHPDWQKNIIVKLRETFPNIQLILTTHSPIVLSGIKSTKIRVLGKNIEGDDVVVSPLAQSYTRSPTEVLQTIMHADLNTNFPEKKSLRKYKNIIEQGDFNSEESNILREELESALGSSHEELIRLSIVKSRREKLG